MERQATPPHPECETDLEPPECEVNAMETTLGLNGYSSQTEEEQVEGRRSPSRSEEGHTKSGRSAKSKVLGRSQPKDVEKGNAGDQGPIRSEDCHGSPGPSAERPRSSPARPP
jgi:hypothetical protein